MKMVRELIVQKGEQELHQQLLTHMKEHNYTRSTKAELEEEVLELHTARIFDNQLWVDFIPFNKRVRPEVLRTVRLISVMPECCKKAGLLTDARYRERDPRCDENFCPHCGRWTKISLVDNQTPKGELLLSAGKSVSRYTEPWSTPCRGAVQHSLRSLTAPVVPPLCSTSLRCPRELSTSRQRTPTMF